MYGSNGLDEYGSAQRPSLSFATPSGTNLGTLTPAFGTPHNAANNYNQLDNCVCVRINQCTSYDIVQGGTSGRETIQGTGTPNSGLVGYNIDPRHKVRGGIDSNYTRGSASEVVPVSIGSKNIHFSEMRGESQQVLTVFKPSDKDPVGATTTTSTTEKGESTSTEAVKSRRKRQSSTVYYSPSNTKKDGVAEAVNELMILTFSTH